MTSTYDINTNSLIRAVFDQFNTLVVNQTSLLSLLALSSESGTGVFTGMNPVDATPLMIANGSNGLAFSGGTPKNKKVEWVEDVLAPTTVTVATQSNIGATTVVVQSAAGIEPNTIMYFRNTLNQSVGNLKVLITSISGNTLTITRPYLGSTDAIIPVGSIGVIQAVAANEYDTGGVPQFHDGTLPFNYTQAFTRTVSMSTRSLNTDSYTRATLMTTQVRNIQYQLMQMIQESLINGIMNDGSANNNISTLGGLNQFLTQAGGNTVTASGALSYDLICDLMQQIFQKGGTNYNPNWWLLVSPTNQRKISRFNATGSNPFFYVQQPYAAALPYGSTVPNLQGDISYLGGKGSAQGMESRILTISNLPDDIVYMIDANRIKAEAQSPMDIIYRTPKETGGSFYEVKIFLDLTFKIMNAKQAHGVIVGIQ
jgi:hypothetical protein